MSGRNLAIGVCSWSLQASSVAELEDLLGRVGASAVHLGLGDPSHGTWEEGDGFVDVARAASFDITATMIGFDGEDYTSPETIRRTGGFGDPARREERLEVFRWAVDRTSELGASILTTHAGFVPEPDDPDRSAFLDCLSEAADYAATREIYLALETGQETAELLRRTIDELEAAFLKVNFDPANMILYNKGDPLHAVEVLASDIIHVHVKDARYPPAAGEWGQEVPVGEGEVGIRDFIETLLAVQYDGPLIVERESGSQEERVKDIASGVRLLKDVLLDL